VLRNPSPKTGDITFLRNINKYFCHLSEDVRLQEHGCENRIPEYFLGKLRKLNWRLKRGTCALLFFPPLLFFLVFYFTHLSFPLVLKETGITTDKVHELYVDLLKTLCLHSAREPSQHSQQTLRTSRLRNPRKIWIKKKTKIYTRWRYDKACTCTKFLLQDASHHHLLLNVW
jgi:hypothetical protein